MSGNTHLPALDEHALLRGLTERERQTLALIAEGLSNKLIARQLGISDGTVKTHLRAIYQELGTRNRTEAVYMAAEQGVRIS